MSRRTVCVSRAGGLIPWFPTRKALFRVPAWNIGAIQARRLHAVLGRLAHCEPSHRVLVLVGHRAKPRCCHILEHGCITIHDLIGFDRTVVYLPKPIHERGDRDRDGGTVW
jgi:hypothetical protein